jgi:hypothetical protein
MKPTPAMMDIRMKRLPRRHRAAHLRALIRLQRAGSGRRRQLLALLRAEMTAPFSEGRRAE